MKTANEWYMDACNAMGNPKLVLENAKKAIEINKDFAEAYYMKGIAESDLSQKQEAINSFDKAISINPGFSQAYYCKGNVLVELKKIEEGLECFEKAISLDPNFSQAYYVKGNLLVIQLKYQEAIDLFDKAISLNPQFSQAYYTKGNALASLKKIDEAIQYFDKALEIDPKLNQAYYTKGNALVDLGRIEEALKFFTKGIELDTNNVLYYCGRARCLTDLGRQPEALKDFAKAQELLKSGNVSSNLQQEHITYVENTLKTIVELHNISHEAEVQMKELEAQKDNPAAKKFAAKIQHLMEERNKVSGKLVGQFGKDKNAETQKHHDDIASLKKQFQEEMEAMKAEMKNLKSDVKELKEDVSNIKDELSTKLSDFKAKLDLELAKLDLKEEDKNNLREYYRAFLETFSSIYVTSQVVDSGQVSLDTGSTATSILSMVASFAPFIGSTLSSAVTTIGEFMQSQEMIKNARKMKGLAADSNELSQLIGKSGYEIVLNPDKQKKILKVTDEELDGKSENLLVKIREFCQKMGDKVDAFLYTRLYKTAAARLGHMDANKLIELWINDKISPYHTQKAFVEKIVSDDSEEAKTEAKPETVKEGAPPTRSSCCNMF